MSMSFFFSSLFSFFFFSFCCCFFVVVLFCLLLSFFGCLCCCCCYCLAVVVFSLFVCCRCCFGPFVFVLFFVFVVLGRGFLGGGVGGLGGRLGVGGGWDVWGLCGCGGGGFFSDSRRAGLETERASGDRSSWFSFCEGKSAKWQKLFQDRFLKLAAVTLSIFKGPQSWLQRRWTAVLTETPKLSAVSAVLKNNFTHFSSVQDANSVSSVSRASDWKARRNTDAGSSPRCGRNFSQSQLAVHTLLRCPCSPSVQQHASTCVRTLQIAKTGSRTIAWTHGNLAHTMR